MPRMELYSPTFAERCRQDFVLGLKLLANGPMQDRVRAEAPTDALVRTTAFRAWAAVTHRSQTMMWDSVEAAAQLGATQAAAELETLAGRPARRGSLELDPHLLVPEPIASVEIHRQPGGYVAERGPHDAIAGFRYHGSSLIYSAGKGQKDVGTDARGRAIAELVRERFPQLAPRRILELGCGIGVATQAIAAHFPGAEYHAIDVGAGLLRFAHLLAEQRGVPLHFHQRDAADTRFPDGHFDLIVSNIFFHETGETKLPAVLRECRRVLARGGGMLHFDVANQRERMAFADRAMNDWQVRWNGEPFWSGFAATDMSAALAAAGFAPDASFAEHVGKQGGLGAWFVFGARG
jgi:SAM-dependent methyltransferase